MIKLIAAAVVLITVLTGRASAQSSAEAFQVGAQLTVARSGQFESAELGIGGRMSWHPVAMLGFESEIDHAIAVVTSATGSQQWGMVTTAGFLALGLIGLSFVREERAEEV